MNPTQDEPRRHAGLVSVVVFLVVGLASALTVAGPGVTWDEPAYRASELRLQDWARSLRDADTPGDRLDLLGPDAIDFYFEFNRFGPNFHPPLSSYGHLATWLPLHPWIDDLSARRVASSLELGMTAAIVCAFLARRFSLAVGLFAGLGVGSFPRVFGDSHVAGTDIPLMACWTLAALLYPSALHRQDRQRWFALAIGLLFLVKFSGLVIVLPIGAAFAIYLVTGDRPRFLLSWLAWSAIIVGPLVPIGLTFLAGMIPTQQGYCRSPKSFEPTRGSGRSLFSGQW